MADLISSLRSALNIHEILHWSLPVPLVDAFITVGRPYSLYLLYGTSSSARHILICIHPHSPHWSRWKLPHETLSLLKLSNIASFYCLLSSRDYDASLLNWYIMPIFYRLLSCSSMDLNCQVRIIETLAIVVIGFVRGCNSHVSWLWWIIIDWCHQCLSKSLHSYSLFYFLLILRIL